MIFSHTFITYISGRITEPVGKRVAAFLRSGDNISISKLYSFSAFMGISIGDALSLLFFLPGCVNVSMTAFSRSLADIECHFHLFLSQKTRKMQIFLVLLHFPLFPIIFHHSLCSFPQWGWSWYTIHPSFSAVPCSSCVPCG